MALSQQLFGHGERRVEKGVVARKPRKYLEKKDSSGMDSISSKRARVT